MCYISVVYLPSHRCNAARVGNSTQWPSTVNMAATFDPKLSALWGTAMGEEWWAKGTNIYEGPGVNVRTVCPIGVRGDLLLSCTGGLCININRALAVQGKPCRRVCCN